jgi:hypothetical protein
MTLIDAEEAKRRLETLINIMNNEHGSSGNLPLDSDLAVLKVAVVLSLPLLDRQRSAGGRSLNT